MDQEINKQNSDVALIKTYEGMYCYGYKPLKPTGRWKIVEKHIQGSVRDVFDISLYIEHKGWFLTRWVHESDIIFERTVETVFECGK